MNACVSLKADPTQCKGNGYQTADIHTYMFINTYMRIIDKLHLDIEKKT